MTTQAEALKSAEPATVRELIARLRQGDADAQIAADLLETRAPVSSEAQPKEEWKCFHCGESFTDRESARLHFGPTLCSEPACQIDAVKVREMEILLARYQEEDTDLHREIYGLQAKHAAELRREEDKGYERGLRDAAQPQEAGQAAPSVPDGYVSGIDANDLEKMAKERPDECFLKGSGVLKLIGAIRQLEREARITTAVPSVSADATDADWRMFGAKVLQQAREYMGDVDGGDIQDWAVEAGLLIEHEATESCGEGCRCVEYGDFPHQCYRYSDEASAAIDAIAAAPKEPTT